MSLRDLAIRGGRPVRSQLLPYARHSVDDRDIAAVTAVLRSDWLTTGPEVARFEAEFAARVGVAHAVALSSGTAALHAAVAALGITRGDEVVVPALTFAATANCVTYCNAMPVFADVDPETLLVDPRSVLAALTAKTKAIIAVDYAGQPCDYDALSDIAESHGIPLIADACHALGGSWCGRSVGTLATLSAFSLHPAKHITAGEGGVLVTADAELAKRARIFRNHGITADLHDRAGRATWLYEMTELGFNYRLTDLQCALALSQLRKLPAFLARRRELARRYDGAFRTSQMLRPLATQKQAGHAYHLYVVQLALDRLQATRAEVFAALRAEGIGVNVHYPPVHLHPYYRDTCGTREGQCPAAEAAYERIITLPLFPAMSDADADDVVTAMFKVTGAMAAEAGRV